MTNNWLALALAVTAALTTGCASTEILDYCGKTCADDCPADYTCEIESGTCVAKDGHCSVEDGGGSGASSGSTTGGETTGGTAGTGSGGASGSIGTTG